MLRSRLCLGLGASVVIAASCSSNDAKQAGGGDSAVAGETTAGAGSDVAGTGALAGGAPGVSGAGATIGGAAAGETMGGAGPGEMTDGWLSGPRLRAVLDVAGTAKLFTQVWHDAKLDVDCAFTVDAAGAERCLPFYSGVTPAFSDAKCTKPVVVYDSAQGTPKYVVAPGYVFECNKGPDYLAIGAKLTGITEVYNDTGSGCVSNGALQPTQVVAQQGAPVPPTTFVGASATVVETRDGRLSANVRVAEDGSREVTSQLDLQRNVACQPRQHQPEGYGCVPPNQADVGTYFAEATCKTPAALHLGYAQQSCGAPHVAMSSSPAFTYYEIGKLLTGTVYQSGASCMAAAALPASVFATFYGVGKAIPFSDFPPLTEKKEGTGQVSVVALRGVEGELVARDGFYDTSLDTPCSVGPATDGKRRCLPPIAYSVNAFADDQCTKALLFLGPGQVPAAGAFLQLPNAGGGTGFVRLDTKIPVPTKVWQRSDTCIPGTVVPADSYFSTTLVPPDKLALVARVVE